MNKATLLLKQIAPLALMFALAACSNTFRSDVATFHSLAAPNGERVAILPMDEARKDSLEFRQYAAVLGNQLRLAGYSQAGDGKPDLIVGFDVTITDGREKLVNRPRMGIGVRNRYWGSYWHYGHYWGPYSPFDLHEFDNELIARTVYTATLFMEVRKPDGELIFEGRAESETRTKKVPEVVPLLAEAMFADFPGESGKTRRIKIELDKSGN